MSVLTKPAPSRPKASDSDLDHYYCCDENTSLCGLDISELQERDVRTDLCVVCDDLFDLTCPNCGE